MPQGDFLNRPGHTLRYDIDDVPDDEGAEGQDHDACRNRAERLLSGQAKHDGQHTAGGEQLVHGRIDGRDAGYDDSEGSKIDEEQDGIAQEGGKGCAGFVDRFHVVGHAVEKPVCNLDRDEHDQNGRCNQQNLAHNGAERVVIKELDDRRPPGIGQGCGDCVFRSIGQRTGSIGHGIGSGLHDCLLLFVEIVREPRSICAAPI